MIYYLKKIFLDDVESHKNDEATHFSTFCSSRIVYIIFMEDQVQVSGFTWTLLADATLNRYVDSAHIQLSYFNFFL